MSIQPRKNIQGLKPYEPGKPIEELEREIGIPASKIIKLASNENPLGPSPKALKAIQKALVCINRYPDGGGFYLKKKLAAKLKVKGENIVLGNGSDELIDIITKTFLEEKDEVIISEPSFLEYKIITRTRGSRIRFVRMRGPVAGSKRGKDPRGFKYDIEKILKSINKNTKLVFFGNPDNPTGAYLNNDELRLFLRRCPKNIILVFDEAYTELTEERPAPKLLNYIKRKNIILLRTFSKAYGLAGVRVGYALCSRDLAGWMERTRQPFNVNMLAQIGAVAALDDGAYLARSRKLINRGRKFLVKELKVLECEIIESPANFILFSYKNFTGTKIFKELLPLGIIVRDMKAYGLKNWARVNVGTMQENKKFISALKKVITQG